MAGAPKDGGCALVFGLGQGKWQNGKRAGRSGIWANRYFLSCCSNSLSLSVLDSVVSPPDSMFAPGRVHSCGVTVVSARLATLDCSFASFLCIALLPPRLALTLFFGHFGGGRTILYLVCIRAKRWFAKGKERNEMNVDAFFFPSKKNLAYSCLP